MCIRQKYRSRFSISPISPLEHQNYNKIIFIICLWDQGFQTDMDELINLSLTFLTSQCLLPAPGSFSLEMSRTPQRLAMLSVGFPMATRWVTVGSACAHLCCPDSTVAATALRFQGREHTFTVQWNVLCSGHSGYKGRVTIIIITSALP